MSVLLRSHDAEFASAQPSPSASDAAASNAMPARLPLSVFIIAKNEADRIAIAIASVADWVDEIVVVDSGSSDGTVELCRSLGARVISHDWCGYGPQKRYAESQCRNDWLLNLDADEEMLPDTAREIRALFAQGEPPLPAYIVRLYDLFPHQRRLMPMGPHKTYVRLYDRRVARFSDSPVHDTVQLPATVKAGRLKGHMAHRSLRSHAHAVEKINAYTTMQAEELYRRGRRFGALRLVFTPPAAFFKAYVLRGYALHGVEGIAESCIFAFSRFLRVAKLRERYRMAEKDGAR